MAAGINQAAPMNSILLVALLGILLALVASGNSLLAAIVFMLIVADMLGGIAGGFISSIWNILTGLRQIGDDEYKELEGAKTKYYSGMKFFEEGITRSAKAVGKGEGAKAQGKKIKDERDSAEIIHTAVSDFMAGLGKILKK